MTTGDTFTLSTSKGHNRRRWERYEKVIEKRTVREEAHWSGAITICAWKFVAQTTIPDRGYRYTEEALPGGGQRTFAGTGAETLDKAQEVRAAQGAGWVRER